MTVGIKKTGSCGHLNSFGGTVLKAAFQQQQENWETKEMPDITLFAEGKEGSETGQ